MTGRRRPIGYVVFAIIALVLIGWLTTRYLGRRHLIRTLGTTDLQVRVEAARALLASGKLGDLLAAQPIIVRSKTAEALGEIGTEEAMAVLGQILRDQEDAPRRWARRALAKQGMRALPVLLSALPAGGGTRDQAIIALGEIGPQTADAVRFLLSDGGARGSAAEALATLGDRGVETLIRACYAEDGGLREAALNALGAQRVKAAVEPALDNLKPLPLSQVLPAIKALGFIGDHRAAPALIPFVEEAGYQESAVTALGLIGDPRAVEPIVSTFLETDKRYRNAAILAVRRIGAPAFPALVRELRSDQVLARRAAAEALIGSASPAVSSALLAAVDDPDTEVRTAAVTALGWDGNLEAVPALVASLSDPEWQVVDAAVESLGEVGVSAVDRLLGTVRSPDTDITVQFQIARAFAAMGGAAVAKLSAALLDPVPAVQKWAAVALGDIGDQRAVDSLKLLAERGSPEARWVAEEQLRRLARASGG